MKMSNLHMRKIRSQDVLFLSPDTPKTLPHNLFIVEGNLSPDMPRTLPHNLFIVEGKRKTETTLCCPDDMFVIFINTSWLLDTADCGTKCSDEDKFSYNPCFEGCSVAALIIQCNSENGESVSVCR